MESFRETEEGLLAEGCRNERKSPKNKDYWTMMKRQKEDGRGGTGFITKWSE